MTEEQQKHGELLIEWDRRRNGRTLKNSPGSDLNAMKLISDAMTATERAAMLACLHDTANAWDKPLPVMLDNLAFATAAQRAAAACRALGLIEEVI